VEALLTERHPSRWAALALPVVMLLVASATVLLAAGNLEDLFEFARRL
jgi:hypothetical protein